MKILAALSFVCCVSAIAQKANPLTENFQARYKTIRANLVETAEAMPEEGYSFKLTSEQRSFGDWIGHTAAGNYGYCATMKGEAAPTANPHDLKSKAELVKAIKDAFDYCDGAVKNLDDAKAMAGKQIAGKTVYPVQGMLALLASNNEHYGNLVGYLRSKGITPPSTARTPKK